LSDARVIEKLEIERRYWAAQSSIEWHISTERELPMLQVEALDWMRGAWDLDDIEEPGEGFIAELMHRVVSYHQLNAWSDAELNAACTHLDEKYDCLPGAHLLVARHLLARRVFATDINRENLWEVPLSSISVDMRVFEELLRLGPNHNSEGRRAA
jgi:hypothetical protein